jgi:hypothetical protein
MKPHHPILKGKGLDNQIITSAITNQMMANPHKMRATTKLIM